MFRHALARRVTFTTQRRYGDILRLAAQLPQLPGATQPCAQPSLAAPALVASLRPFSSNPTYRHPTADKPAAKKATKAKSGAARKKKTAAKKKKPVKKPAPKPKKKFLTEEQLAAKEVQAKRDEIKKLKEAALLTSEPRTGSLTAFNVFVADRAQKGAQISTVMKELGDQFKQLSAADLEHYNHLANTQGAEAARNHAAWVTSHTPLQIRAANNARRLLNKRIEEGQTGYKVTVKKARLIKDERQVSGVRNALTIYIQERFNSGDFKGIPNTEAMKLAAQEFQQLGAMEQKKYRALQEEDQVRYAREFEQTYGYPPRSRSAGE